MLTRFEAHEFGCLRDVALDLTPLHAFIGPNDSGKSTLLRAIGTLAHIAGATYEQDQENLVALLRPSLPPAGPSRPWLAGVASGAPIEVRTDGQRPGRIELLVGQGSRGIGPWNNPQRGGLVEVTAPALVRFDPDALRRASPVSSDKQTFLRKRGFGLPTMLLHIKGRDDESWPAFRRRVRELFPSVTRVEIKPDPNEMRLELTLATGQQIGAEQCSEGLLYYLAFASLGYLDAPSRVLLIEEPENGLHPARIREIVGLLRHLSKTGVQVILATHSPLVVNELRADEITLVTRDPQLGTRLTPIAKTPNFAERSKIYALGELWLSYADGNAEAPLTQGNAAE